MSVSVIDNTAHIQAEINAKAPLALRLMLDDIDLISTPGTPKKHGDLRMNKLKQVLGMHAVIQWRQIYASRLEEKQFRHYTTPGTGPHFAEKAVKRIVEDSAKYFRRAGL